MPSYLVLLSHSETALSLNLLKEQFNIFTIDALRNDKRLWGHFDLICSCLLLWFHSFLLLLFYLCVLHWISCSSVLYQLLATLESIFFVSFQIVYSTMVILFHYSLLESIFNVIVLHAIVSLYWILGLVFLGPFNILGLDYHLLQAWIGHLIHTMLGLNSRILRGAKEIVGHRQRLGHSNPMLSVLCTSLPSDSKRSLSSRGKPKDKKKSQPPSRKDMVLVYIIIYIIAICIELFAFK